MNKLIVNLLVLYLAIGFNFCKSDSIYFSRNGGEGYVSLAESEQAFTTPCTYKDHFENLETKRYMISLDEATQNHYLNINFTSDGLPENVVFRFDDFDQHESITPIGYSLCKGGENQIYFNLALNNMYSGGDVIISITADVSKMCGPVIEKPETSTPEIPDFSYQTIPEKYNRTVFSSGTSLSFNSLLIFGIFIIFFFI
ncbi:hypothetical protein CYY_007279 [Polysphondylium violaceum]|uniref:Uncharacterized protein n=1 Tax=Polysphondylium violaceum TaxID=133409 RepID=A0A8J4UXS8_9MYCE|nr:hypothetical protein CYY_007279 [Polysphondylium violaceum]